jgi:signal transduction histidine kinase
MHTRTNLRRRAVFAAPPVAKAAGYLVIAIAAVVLAAWAAKTVGWEEAPSWIFRMNPMTAASLVLAGGALLLPRRSRASADATLKLAFGMAISAIALLKLAQITMGRPIGVDLLLFPRQVQSVERGLMAPNTALALLLLGGSLMLSTRRWRRAALGAQILAAGSLAVATTGLIDYAYGAIGLVEFANSSAMAFQTAVALAIASVGALWTRPHRALTGIITNPTLGGALARRLLPIIVLTTVGFGAIRVAMARRGMFDEVTGVAMLITAVLMTLVAVVLLFAQNLRGVSLRLARREQALREAASALTAAKLEAERANAAKSRFLAAANHDLRQPLHAAGAYLSVLARKLEEPALKEICDKTRQPLAAMKEILDTLLDVSRLESGALEPHVSDFPIDDIFARVVVGNRPQAEEKGLRLVHVPSGCSVRSDPALLERVIDNLVSNGIRYTKEGQVTVQCEPRDGKARITVSDTGIGIPAEALDGIFEEYVQLDNPSRDRSKGLGLGLSVVRYIADVLGHGVEVRSMVGKGSTFVVEVPLVADAPTRAGRSVAPLAAPPLVLDSR